MKDHLYIGVKGHVVCLDRRTGTEIWKTHLKSSGLTNLVIQDDLIIAHTKGELFALKMTDGAILWNNPLTGLGYGHCLIAGNSQNTVSVIAQQDAEHAAAASGGAGGAG